MKIRTFPAWLRHSALGATVALFTSVNASPSSPVDDCLAYAGGIDMEYGPHCLVSGSATLTATPLGNAQVPAGFTTLYLLSRTNGLIIEEVSTTPSFSVTTVDVWRIHTLVYDPASLDLSDVVFGTTHAYELQNILIQGGGSVCAGLDMNGGGAKTVECTDACTADAGTISPLNPDQCLLGFAMLEAVPDGNATVPQGYSVLHVLTTGPDQVVIGSGSEPSFAVDFVGAFAIHTLVYDPATLDISSVVPDETTAADIAALLLQGGGSICGSLDMVGAQFQVADCTPVCDAYAGTLTPAESEVCLVNGIAHVDALPNGDAVVPNGFSVAYILARANGIIENVEAVTLFEWPLAGNYVIHTVVYDPFTLNPFAVFLGVTPIAEINALLVQGGGSVCGSLDLVGAPVSVITCAPPCEENAGIGGDRLLCFTDPVTDLFSLLTGGPDEGGSWSAPDGSAFSGSFNPATDAQGVYVYYVSDGPDCPGDTAQVVISLIECPGPCDADAGSDASVVLCSNQQTFNLFTLLNGDVGGSWSNPTGLASSGNFNPGTDAPGTYTYVVGASAECDGDTARVSVSVNAAPDAGTNAQVSVCDSDAPFFCLVLLGGTPGTGGTWTGPNGAPFDGTFDPAIDLPGIYIYTVQGVAPCADATATLVISVAPCCTAGEDADTTVCFVDPPFLMFDLLGGNPCPGGTWTGPDANTHSGIFIPSTDPSGVYVYTVVGQNGTTTLSTLSISVIECPTECEAEAGTLLADQAEVCLDNGIAMVMALPNNDAFEPAGFITVFLLTQGQDQVISQLFNAPLFTVETPGIWTVHTFIYDLSTFSLSSIVDPGLTTLSEVNALLIQGGGNICASLDLAGAQFFVSECTDPCAGSTPDAGVGGDIIRCDIDPITELFDLLQGTPDVGGSWTGPDGAAFPGAFDPASDASGVYVYTVFDLLDCEPDTTQLNISVVVCPEAPQQLIAWPNPSVDKVNIRFPAVLSAGATIDILDALGRSVRPSITIAGDLITVDISTMPSGTYTLRAFDAGKVQAGRFARARD